MCIRDRSKASEGVDSTAAQCVVAADAAIAEAGVKKQDIAGLGMGVPGHIDPAGKTVLWAPNFYTEDAKPYRNIAFADPVAQKIGLPVLMGNDANVAALANSASGPGGRCATWLC